MLREIDRRDLTISLRERLGDWFRVVQVGADNVIHIGDIFVCMHWLCYIYTEVRPANRSKLKQPTHKHADFACSRLAPQSK